MNHPHRDLVVDERAAADALTFPLYTPLPNELERCLRAHDLPDPACRICDMRLSALEQQAELDV